MPKEERRISPAVAIIPVGLGLAAVVGIAALAWAAPPKVYTCPYCGAEFATEEELLAHIAAEHPEIPPIAVYKVSVDFRREPVCMTSRGDECLEYFSDEREGIITVVNEGTPGLFTTTVEGWFYLSGAPNSKFKSAQWTNYFEAGQTRTYSFEYMIPTTGMPFDSRFFIKVYDPDGEIIADRTFITSQ